MSETPRNDPPRIRDDRRDPDLTRLKERVSVCEESLKDHESRLDDHSNAFTGVNHTLYGIPQDKTSLGLVGSIAEVKTSLQSANNKLLGILGTVVLGVVLQAVIQLSHG